MCYFDVSSNGHNTQIVRLDLCLSTQDHVERTGEENTTDEKTTKLIEKGKILRSNRNPRIEKLRVAKSRRRSRKLPRHSCCTDQFWAGFTDLLAFLLYWQQHTHQ
mmetsp:Transcript_7671/g.15220  ORF Transcript_7671/g.15220 Transcript_7671/m.15220 type:complete len:105 (+) Transcript_7671:188-502(+)